MIDIINVAIGAMLGVILATQPMFKEPKLKDMPLVIFFVALTVLFACNIGITLRAMRAHQRQPQLIIFSIGAFLVTEIAVFLAFTLAELPTGQEGYAIKYSYVWSFVVITLFWFFSNVVGEMLEHKGGE